MNEEVLLNRVVRYLEERANALGEAIVGGDAQTFDEYKHMSGRIRGLNEAVNIIREAMDEYSEED